MISCHFSVNGHLVTGQKFFDKTRERILQSTNSRLESDPFGQFVREHQERFAALTASIMGDAHPLEVIGKQQQNSKAPNTSTAIVGDNVEKTSQFNSSSARHETSQQEITESPSAADLVASILNGKKCISLII